MKALTTALIGTGAGALVLLVYLSLGQQQETKKDIQVDKAKFELEKSKFDKSFDEKWTEFDGKKPSKELQAAHDKNIQGAQKELDDARSALNATSAQSKKDLAAIKTAIDTVDKKEPTNK